MGHLAVKNFSSLSPHYLWVTRNEMKGFASMDICRFCFVAKDGKMTFQTVLQTDVDKERSFRDL